MMAIQYFLIPYEHFKDGEGDQAPMWRRLPLATEKSIFDAKGYWSETEIDEDRAIVRVRAPKSELKNLATEYQKIKDPKEFWTPRRRLVSWNDEEPVLEDEAHRTRTLYSLDNDVLDDKQYSAFRKEVEALMKQADKEGYVRIDHPWAYATKLLNSLGDKGYGLKRVSTGTFPVNTTVLDSFTRGDVTNSLGASWTADFIGASWASHGVLSNTAYAAANFKTNRYNVASYGPDTEVYLTIQTLQTTGNNGICARITNNETSSVHFYELRWDASANGPWFFRWDSNGGGTQLGANTFVTVATGNRLGLEAIGSTLTLYKDTGGGFSSSATRTDITYTRAGYTGLMTNSGTTTRMDDFVAGSIGATPTFLVPISDITLGDYAPTPSSPTTLYDKLDETPASDTDYISGTTTVEVKLG